jgi:subfamily B ATP-binding cassette protein MsbA
MKTPTKEFIARLKELLKPHRNRLIVAIVCMVGVSATMGLLAYLIKPGMDDIFVKKDLRMLKVVPAAFLAVSMIKAFCQWGSDYNLQSIGLTVVSSLRQKLYDHIQDMPLSFFDHTSTGVLMSRITSDVNEIQQGVTKAIAGLIRDSLTVVGLLYVVFYQNWRLAIAATIVLPVAFYPVFRFGSRLRKLAKRRQESMGDLNVILHETFTGTRIVKAFTMEQYEKKRFSASNQRVLGYNLKSLRLDTVSSPLMEFIGSIGIAAVLWYGGYQVITGASTPGTFFSFMGAILMLYKPVKSISKVNNVLQKAVASTIRVYEILNMKRDLTEADNAIELPAVRGAVEFKNVHFAYSQKVVLKDINLQIQPGEVIALVGSSGGGKTTLANLIPRFYDVLSGSILIDGYDVRDLTLNSLRRQIAIVTQQSFLFNDTARNNIAYGDPSRDETAVINASKAAYAYDFIRKLPLGFDTVIGEQGVMLSGGQRQRMCIARALLKDAPILILDEATSSLDSEAELEVQRALENLMAGRTTFVIAHRLSTIQYADRILVISGGRIVEEGTHRSLLAQNGEYRRLHDIQFQQSQ